MNNIGTSMAVNADMAVNIQQVDEGYLAQPGNCRYSLGIHLPFLMCVLHWLFLWLWQIFMALIFANFSLFFQVCCNPRTAGYLQASKENIFRYFQFQRLWTPTRMFFSQR